MAHNTQIRKANKKCLRPERETKLENFSTYVCMCVCMIKVPNADECKVLSPVAGLPNSEDAKRTI